MSHSRNPLSDLKGKNVYGRDGEKVGKITDFYFDNETDEPVWFKVGSGLFGSKHYAIPVRGYSVSEDGVYVPYSSSRIEDSPEVDGDGMARREAELYAHYGFSRDDALETLPQDAADRRIGIRDVETGTVRLHKWVETQPVREEVKVQRETARIERQELDEPVTDAEIGEREIELTFRHEEAFFEKTVMARERVTLSKSIEERTEVLEGRADQAPGVYDPTGSASRVEEVHHARN